MPGPITNEARRPVSDLSNASYPEPAASVAPRVSETVAANERLEVYVVSSQAARPGETYQECVDRTKLETSRDWAAGGALAGCAAGATTGMSKAGPLGAVAGCVVGAIPAYMAASSEGAERGEARGKVDCNGAPGSPADLREPEWREPVYSGAGGAPSSSSADRTGGGRGATGGASCWDGRVVADARECRIAG